MMTEEKIKESLSETFSAMIQVMINCGCKFQDNPSVHLDGEVECLLEDLATAIHKMQEEPDESK